MPDNDNDVILAAVSERLLQSIDASKSDRLVSLIINIATLCLLVRRKFVTLEDAVSQIELVSSRLVQGAATDDLSQRISETIDWLRTCASADHLGEMIEGSLADFESDEEA